VENRARSVRLKPGLERTMGVIESELDQATSQLLRRDADVGRLTSDLGASGSFLALLPLLHSFLSSRPSSLAVRPLPSLRSASSFWPFPPSSGSVRSSFLTVLPYSPSLQPFLTVLPYSPSYSPSLQPFLPSSPSVLTVLPSFYPSFLPQAKRWPGWRLSLKARSRK
jgi:hypothetical protein